MPTKAPKQNKNRPTKRWRLRIDIVVAIGLAERLVATGLDLLRYFS